MFFGKRIKDQYQPPNQSNKINGDQENKNFFKIYQKTFSQKNKINRTLKKKVIKLKISQ